MRKVALVTGGGRDIGRGIVERLAGTHAAVGVHAHASRAAAAEVAARLSAAGTPARAFAADLGRPDGAAELFAALDGWLADLGPDHCLFTLVNNAAATAASPLAGTPADALDALVDVNLKGTFRVTTEAARRLADGGRVVNVTLDSHAVFAPDYALFTATKAAVDVLTRHWAAALGPRGVTVNSVAPGVVDVNFRADMLRDAGFRAGLEAATALGRVGQTGDVADVVAFLASDAARWVTGQVVAVSGGWRL